MLTKKAYAFTSFSLLLLVGLLTENTLRAQDEDDLEEKSVSAQKTSAPDPRLLDFQSGKGISLDNFRNMLTYTDSREITKNIGLVNSSCQDQVNNPKTMKTILNANRCETPLKLNNVTQVRKAATNNVNKGLILNFQRPQDLIAFFREPKYQKTTESIEFQLAFNVNEVPLKYWEKLGEFKLLKEIHFPENIHGKSKESVAMLLGVNRGLEHIAPALAKCKNITHLTMVGQRFGGKVDPYIGSPLSVLGKVLEGFPMLSYLNLNKSFVGMEGYDRFVDSLKKATELTKLYLLGNKLGSASQEITSLLPKSKIVLLQLASNKLGSEDFKKLNDDIMGSNLTTLGISSNKITKEGLEYLSKSIQEKLVTLYIYNSGLKGKDIEAFAKSVASSKTLEDLFIGDNPIRIVGIESLGPALQNRLSRVSLSNTYIRSEAAQILAGYLFNSTKLKQLDLSNNMIGPEGAKFLAVPFQKAARLSDIALYGNELKSEGVRAVAKAMNLSKKKMVLEVGKNDELTDDDIVYLHELEQKNPNIKFNFSSLNP